MVLRIFLRVIAQTLQVSSPGAATVHPPAPLLWRAGTQFAAQGCCHGDGTERSGATRATGAGAGRASQHGCRRGRTWGRQPTPNPDRARPASATPAFGALPVGGVDCPNLRSVPFVVPHLRRAHAHHKPSSPTAPTSGKYWTTSGWMQSHRASPRHAGRRCGMAAVRRWAMVSRVPTLSQMGPLTGTRRPNRRRLMRLISASVGKGWRQRFFQRCGAGLRPALLRGGHIGKFWALGPQRPLQSTWLGGFWRPQTVSYLTPCGWISYP